MINKNELRFGNKVQPDKEHAAQFNNIRVWSVTQIYEGGFTVDYHWPGKWFEGIPLTPEILQAAGFEKRGEPFRRWISDEIGIDITQGPNNDYFARFIKRYRKSGNTMYADRNGPYIEMIFCPTSINHLHTLMNLWQSITGTELAINLEKLKV